MSGGETGLEGTLVLAPGEAGLDARVRFIEDELVIETSDGERERWTKHDIAAEPYDTSTMTLTLGTSRLYFQASDPLVFAEELQSFLRTPTKRRKRKERARRRDEPVSAVQQTVTASIAAPSPATEPARTEDISTVVTQVAESTEPVEAQSKKRRTKREHEHDYVQTEAGGGIVRRVCAVCRHVSIDLTGRFELTGDPTPMFSRRL